MIPHKCTKYQQLIKIILQKSKLNYLVRIINPFAKSKR